MVIRKLILMLLICVPCFAADNIYYADAVVTTKLIKNSDGTALILDLPYRIFSQTIICEGVDVTYNLTDMKLEGKEVIANIHYAIKDYKDVVGETAKVKADKCYIAEPLKSAKYLSIVGKAEAFCVSDVMEQPIKEVIEEVIEEVEPIKEVIKK